MVDWDDPQRTLKPLIDGGTEGKRSIFKVPCLTYLQDSVGKHVLSFPPRVLAMSVLSICLQNVLFSLSALLQLPHDYRNIALSGHQSWNGRVYSQVSPLDNHN